MAIDDTFWKKTYEIVKEQQDKYHIAKVKEKIKNKIKYRIPHWILKFQGTWDKPLICFGLIANCPRNSEIASTFR